MGGGSRRDERRRAREEGRGMKDKRRGTRGRKGRS